MLEKHSFSHFCEVFELTNLFQAVKPFLPVFLRKRIPGHFFSKIEIQAIVWYASDFHSRHCSSLFQLVVRRELVVTPELSDFFELLVISFLSFALWGCFKCQSARNYDQKY